MKIKRNPPLLHKPLTRSSTAEYWADGNSLVVPPEVRNETELALVATLVRRLVLGQTTLEAEFSGYRHSRVDWFCEQISREVMA